MKPLPIKAKVLVGVAVLSSTAAFAKAMLNWGPTHDYPKFLAYLVVAVLATRLKISLPRMTGSMSVNLPFILIAVFELGLPEALIIAGVSAFVQSFWPESKKRNLVQVAYNVSILMMAAELTRLTIKLGFHNTALVVATGSLTVLLANTLPVAGIIAATEGGQVVRIWTHIVNLTFPYYGLTAGLAALVKLADYAVGWQTPLFIMPVMFLVYRSYMSYFRQMSESAPTGQMRAMTARAGV